jgi:hypothetical protein
MSQRVLIVGVSESGKTALANRLIEGATIPVFVRDPIGAKWSNITARFETSDELRQLIAEHKNQGCIVVIDEAADFFGVGQKENHWIFTRGRHAAILPIAIGQRIKMMSPNVREQASDLYVFESSIEASAILAEAYNMPELENAPDLLQGEFFHVRRVDGKRILTAHKLW